MESCCPRSVGRGHLVAGLGPFSAIASVVAGPGSSQLTIAARTAVFVGGVNEQTGSIVSFTAVAECMELNAGSIGTNDPSIDLDV